jgi:predicted GNAT family N-acyltransferase
VPSRADHGERLEIRWARDEQDLDAAIALRRTVFCEEQGVPPEEELDGRDGEALHLLAQERSGDATLGTLRLLFDGDTVKVGRVAVQRSRRGRGIASRMLEIALERASARGCRRARLASQLEAVGLYERAGFAVDSDVFLEAGIEHVWMTRELESRA